MFKLKSLLVFIFAFSSIILSAHAEDEKAMTPPKPLENKVYDAMVGTWTATSDMMGKKMHDVIKIRWSLNHQFLIMKLKGVGVDDPKVKYDGMGIFGVDAKGKAKTWWFDSWGADSATIGTGEFKDNMLTIEDGNDMFNETRSFEAKGKEMIMKAKGKMMWEGKETPFDETTVYKKK